MRLRFEVSGENEAELKEKAAAEAMQFRKTTWWLTLCVEQVSVVPRSYSATVTADDGREPVRVLPPEWKSGPAEQAEVVNATGA